MIRFLDGPAAKHVLTLRRAPVLLRVVCDRKGNWDGLDQLDDTPAPHETIHVYRRVGEPTYMHICRRPRGSGWVAMAEYQLVGEQPGDDVTRSTDAWRAWCNQIQERAPSAPVGGAP